MTIDEFGLVQTCGACPEQYDVFLEDHKVGYMRLRHGCFTVELFEPGGKLVYKSEDMRGDGCFDVDERDHFLNQGIRAIRLGLLAEEL